MVVDFKWFIQGSMDENDPVCETCFHNFSCMDPNYLVRGGDDYKISYADLKMKIKELVDHLMEGDDSILCLLAIYVKIMSNMGSNEIVCIKFD